jgi:hypothetical protein
MATGLEQHDDDAMQEILRRAMQKDGTHGQALRDRLLTAADELGISHESVIEAEREYNVARERNQELAAYRKHLRKEFKAHLGIYVAVNFFLILINVLTFRNDHELWALFPLLGWGIGLVIHAINALGKPDWDDEEFQKWRKEKKEGLED